MPSAFGRKTAAGSHRGISSDERRPGIFYHRYRKPGARTREISPPARRTSGEIQDLGLALPAEVRPTREGLDRLARAPASLDGAAAEGVFSNVDLDEGPSNIPKWSASSIGATSPAESPGDRASMPFTVWTNLFAVFSMPFTSWCLLSGVDAVYIDASGRS